MIQTCNAERWKTVGKLMRADSPCGRTFDDVRQSTQCPHDPLGLEGAVCRESDLFKSACPHCKRMEGEQ